MRPLDLDDLLAELEGRPMDREIEVAIAGGHGKIARLLGAPLVGQGALRARR